MSVLWPDLPKPPETLSRGSNSFGLEDLTLYLAVGSVPLEMPYAVVGNAGVDQVQAFQSLQRLKML